MQVKASEQVVLQSQARCWRSMAVMDAIAGASAIAKGHVTTWTWLGATTRSIHQCINTLSILPSASVGTAHGPSDTIETDYSAARILTPLSGVRFGPLLLLSVCCSPPVTAPSFHLLRRPVSASRDINSLLCSAPSPPRRSAPSSPAVLARCRSPRRSHRSSRPPTHGRHMRHSWRCFVC
jgi:hypothetical protein